MSINNLKRDGFKVGDQVIYPAHGVGEIINEESQTIGEMIVNVFVISFTKEKMILRVPTNRAKSCGLRHLSTKADLKKVFSLLQGRAKASKGMWSRRA